MVIRKQFKFEGAHIVRNCSSERCKKSIHGHSYVVEVFFEAQALDRGMMVYDFGLTKGTIKDFIDGFDHAYSMWDKESNKFKEFMYESSDRWVEMPVSPSAEAYSLMFLKVIDAILQHTEMMNGEQFVQVSSVRVHETTTGYAESFRCDLENPNMPQFNLGEIKISEGVMSEWENPDMFKQLCEANAKVVHTGTEPEKIFKNKTVQQQIK
jgi:6-pyruvoyltetrahydropterin/6-carboxytetrahydropterin synthase